MTALYDSVIESPHVYHINIIVAAAVVQLEHNGQCIVNYRCTSRALLGIFCLN